MDYLNIFLYFIIYSFFGWVAETIYCSVLEKRFVYRGFLNGPICPIYGFGALFVLYFIKDLVAYPILVFFLSVIITSTLEYITSFILEKLFHMKWWDYSNKKFNINGRVCLLNSTLFGLLSLFLLYVVQPRVVNFVGNLSDSFRYRVGISLFIVISVDTIATVKELFGLNTIFTDLKEKLEEKEKSFLLERDTLIKRFKEKERQLELKSYLDKLELKRQSFKDGLHSNFYKNILGANTRRILDSYPNIKYKLDPNLIKNIRKYGRLNRK